jgi:ubiquinone/menaquinone biosynthesis C-methylase UbiE
VTIPPAGSRQSVATRQPSSDQIRERAIAAYYWKPMAALVRTLELGAYARANLPLAAPVLDLGCGDGLQARLLTDLGLVERPLCGLDIVKGSVGAAARAASHRAVLVADAGHLPLRSATFQTIVSSTLFSSIPGSVTPALHEARRVLTRGGTLTTLCPTDAFNRLLWAPQALERVSTRLRDEYCRRLDARLLNFHNWPVHEWVSRIEAARFRVVRVLPYFAARAARLWSLWSLQLLRVLTCLRFLPPALPQAAMTGLLGPSIARACASDDGEGPHGLVFIAAEAV